MNQIDTESFYKSADFRINMVLKGRKIISFEEGFSQQY